MEHSTPNKRRYLSFSLRSLFVVMTVFALYLAWGLNWVRERKAFLETHDAHLEAKHDPLAGPPANLPLVLRLLGEPGVHAIFVFGFEPEELLKETQCMFPEAEVGAIPPPPPIPTA